MKRQMFVVALTLLASASVCFGQKTKDKPQESPPNAQEEEEKFTRYLLIKPEPGDTSLPPILTGALQPVELPAGKDSWAVQVVTRGGFAGGGKGDVTISSGGSVTCLPATNPCADKLSPAALQSLAQKVLATKPSKWEGSALSTCRDCYVTMLVLHRREKDGHVKTYTAYWDDTTGGKMSAEVRRIYGEAVMLAAPDK